MTVSLFLTLCVCQARAGLAQESDVDYTYLNAGVKVGIALDGGITFGAEISVGAWNGFFGGGAAGFDYTVGGGTSGGVFRLYLEGELGILIPGISYGAALVVDDGKLFVGRQFSVFAGWPVNSLDPDKYQLLIPYYRKSSWGDGESSKVIGVFYKNSYPIGKGNYNSRWDWD